MADPADIQSFLSNSPPAAVQGSDLSGQQLQAPADSAGATPILQSQQQQPPQMGGQPLLYQFMKEMFSGPRGNTQDASGQYHPAQSRGDMTLNFLGSFLSNLSQGLAQAGHGPGANLRGFAAGVQAPYQRELQQYQLGQQQQAQQSTIQEQQSRAQLAEAQAEQQRNIVQTPYGPMSAALAAKVFPAAINAQGREGAAGITGASRVTAAQIAQGGLVDVPKDLQTRFNVPAQLPINQLNKLQAAATKAPSEIGLIQRANGGDQDAKEALNVLMQNRKEVAAMRNNTRGVEVLDFDSGGNPITRYMTMGDAIKNSASGAVQGGKNLSRTQQLQDIQYSSTQLRGAIQGLEKEAAAGGTAPFSPAQIAKMQIALTSNDEKAISTQWGALVSDRLTPAQQDMVLWLKNINERALSLRNIAGQGQGAQDTRNAIRSLLPNLASGNTQMMYKQLDAFDNQTSILAKGIPAPGNRKIPTPAPTAGAGGSSTKYSPGNPFAPKQ